MEGIPSPRSNASPSQVAQTSHEEVSFDWPLKVKVRVRQIERWEGHARQREQLVQGLREPGFLAPVSALVLEPSLLPRPVTKVLTFAKDGMSPSLWRRGGLRREGRGGKDTKKEEGEEEKAAKRNTYRLG